MADLSSSESLGETLKIVFIFIVLAVSLFFGYFPLYCKVRRNSHRLLGFFNSFTGGVFMGIGLFLLLPKGKEEMEAYFSSEEHSSDFFKSIPLTFFLAFLSYSFMLLIEKVLFNSPALIPFLSAAEGEVGHSHSHGHEESHSHNEIKASKEEKSQEHVLDEEDSDEDEEAFKNIVSTKGKYGSFMQIRNLRMSKLDGNKKIDRALLKSSQLMNKTFNFGANNPDMDLLVNPKQSDYNQACSHVHGESDLKLKPQSNAKIYFMISALCFDGFFEGLALGVQDSWEKVVFVALAIVINKFAVALSLGVSFKKCSMEIQTFIRLIILFSMFCPLGIVLGYILAESQIARAILLSISAGTFIYVSCSVVIIEEFAITRHKYSKYTCFFMGGVLTTAICIAGIAINN